MITQQQFTPGPTMVRLASGQMVPASVPSKRGVKASKLLLVIQYYEGDRDAAEDLASLIADLERVKNRDADILMFGRNDARAPSRDIMSKLESKFDKVMFERCRRADGKGHPWGANSMFYDLVTLFGQVSPWAETYYAFVNLETDCVPTRQGWIGELINGWKQADQNGKGCFGFIHDDPRRHMNGVGLYAIDIWSRVGANKLSGGNPQIAYDIRQAENILPLAEDSGLFYFEYQRPTITPDDLFAERRNMGAPAIWHGVKDGSARAAVRARHITFTEEQTTSRQTVVTFYEQFGNPNKVENTALLDLWREGWKSRGWNPVILSMRDAAKHVRFTEIQDHVKKLPAIGASEAHMNRFMRWVALARVGGGLMVDYDLIPASLTPNDLRDDAFAIFDAESRELVGLRLTKDQCEDWLDAILAYDAKPEDVKDGRPCVTDGTIMRSVADEFGIAPDNQLQASAFGIGEWKNADVIHFSQRAVDELKPGSRKSVAVDAYLRAK